ncbi:hypothetical protein [Pseudoalteromonas tunicata]|jgi:hypothetical protein|uniref:hypothetical protein n=1 Tax=Pseudoalteromonas tunicata TaxID=314281 RepID=UPI000320E61F|nr:hypothetical protein [Pseudoalteromonas tunicata]
MPTSKIDFHNAECSACCKKHVDIRTEIIAPSPDRPNAIRKKIIFRCEDHLDSDIDEIEKLALVKNRFQNLDENDLVDGDDFLNMILKKLKLRQTTPTCKLEWVSIISVFIINSFFLYRLLLASN